MPLCPYFWNCERRRHQGAGLAAGLEADALAVPLRQLRLGVEGIDLRRPAVHEQVDDALGLGREVRRLGSERIGQAPGRAASCIGQQARQTEHTEAGARAGQEFAAGNWQCH